MIPAYLTDIFEVMGLETDGIALDLTLGGDGLGMDSQEIIELYGRLGRALNLTLPPNTLKRTTTLAEVVQLVNDLGVLQA